MRTTLESAVGTGNAYTYSVKDPRSDRERYILAAPMDLRLESQIHLTRLLNGGVERTNRIATVVAGNLYSNVWSKRDFDKYNFIPYVPSRRASEVTIKLGSQRNLVSVLMHLIPRICPATGSTISICPSTGVIKR